jgi:ATP-binding cassette, subfamily C (CFTR/MRP), member 1
LSWDENIEKAAIQFSQVTSNVIEAIVSVNRLKNFFDAEEMQPDARTVIQPSRPLSAGDNVYFLPLF